MWLKHQFVKMHKLTYEERRHSYLVTNIYDYPFHYLNEIEKDRILYKQTEKELWLNNSLLTVPDIYIQCPDYDIFIEIKGTNSNGCLNKGLEQNLKTQWWLNEVDYDKPCKIGLVYPLCRNTPKDFSKLLKILQEKWITYK